MASQIEQLRVSFQKMNTVQKKQFIANLKQKLQGSNNAEYIKFLNECVQKYNVEVRGSSSDSVPTSTARVSSYDDENADNNVPHKSKQKNPLKGVVIALSLILVAVFIGGGVFIVSTFNNGVSIATDNNDRESGNKSVDDFLKKADYESAIAIADEKYIPNIRLENEIAYLSSKIYKTLKDPSSFTLVDVWNDENHIVLKINGTNSFGGIVTAYWYYWRPIAEKSGRISSDYEARLLGDNLGAENTSDYAIYSDDYSLDTAISMFDRNKNRERVSSMINNSSIIVSSSIIDNVQYLHENGFLDRVNHLDADFWRSNKEALDNIPLPDSTDYDDISKYLDDIINSSNDND